MSEVRPKVAKVERLKEKLGEANKRANKLDT